MAEIEENTESESVVNKKRELPSDNSETTLKNKKVRLNFSAKEFRNSLKTAEKLSALQNFLQLLKETTKHDYVLSYLDKGGDILEILQVMETDQSIPPILVFEITNLILLQIQAKYAQYQTIAFNACRYILNTYIVQINKMLNLSSSTNERLITLKLLTTMVTASAVLAKDILLHVNFNPTNLELLTKVAEGKIEVRNAFVLFVAAFIVDGHLPTISILLEKKGLLTSIIAGLKFDKVETVVVILTAIKNHIVENVSISKTTKMKTFNTVVLRDIVKLYNWKGPGAVRDVRKKTNKIFEVDEVEKSKVSEAVHALLLVLCGSHKFGVVFRDSSLGLNRICQNTLISSVLTCLERPWDHSYASQLVLAICKACPDLTKSIWKNMKEFISPRTTDKWITAMRFAGNLIDQFQPDALQPHVKDLTAHQVVHIIINLCAPLSIIKVVLPEGVEIEHQSVKYHILGLFLKMATAIQRHLNNSHSWTNLNQKTIVSALSNYVNEHFPDCKFILDAWDRKDQSIISEQSTILDYVNVAFDLLKKYKELAPGLLDPIGPVYDIKEFLAKTETISDADHLELRKFQVKAVGFLIELEPGLFTIKNDLFHIVMNFSMEYYYESQDVIAFALLNVLLKITGFFDAYPMEISLWIDGILNTNTFNVINVQLLVDLIKRVDQNSALYYKKLHQLKNSNFSPLLLALIDYANDNDVNKSIKAYLNFVLLNIYHLQYDSTCFREILLDFTWISSDLKKYIANWGDTNMCTLTKCKGKILGEFQIFSTKFLEENIEKIDFTGCSNFKIHFSQAAMFYYTNLVQFNIAEPKHNKNLLDFVRLLFENNNSVNENLLKIFLGHPVILEKFTLFDSDDLSTNFVMTFVKELKNINNIQIDNFLSDFRTRITNSLQKVFKKPQKYANKTITTEIIDTFDLDYDQCTQIMTKFVNSDENRRFFKVAIYCLDRMATLALHNYTLSPLSNKVIETLSKFFVALIVEQSVYSFSAPFLNYLKTFPHNTEGVQVELFEKLILLPDYNKDNILLCEFLLERKQETFPCFVQHLEDICAKKGFILPLLHVVLAKNNEEVLEKVFKILEPQVAKAMQKPHKAGQHFQNNYKTLAILMDKFILPQNYGNQVHKYETTETFHVYLLNVIFGKVEKSEKKIANMTMTFVHQLVNVLKQQVKQKDSINDIAEIFANFLNGLDANLDLSTLNKNESLKMLAKLCLKYGIGNNHEILLNIVGKLIELKCLDRDETNLVLEMLLSHSQFLDVVLGPVKKTELLMLWSVIIKLYPEFMRKTHIPVLLSAYGATRRQHDRIALTLLKMYESKPEQTEFFAYKPFLWGQSAASYYSVRSDVQKVLWRQPKMGDVLDNLEHSRIVQTITDPEAEDAYDLDFFLPLFCHLLSPENPVYTYRFTKSGALALTVTGLHGAKLHRFAACQVLSRFHFHLEARQTGKDTALWLRFIEAISIGLASSDEVKFNSFSTIYLALSALVLTQPEHVMYLPLTQYLVAKDSLQFSTIPELYTFLHSSDVNFKDQRMFILDVIKHGLKDDEDFASLLRSMAFKLISELFSSSLADNEIRLIILDVYKECCKSRMGFKVLCGSLSFLSQISTLLITQLNQQNDINDQILRKLLELMYTILKRSDSDKHKIFVVYVNLVMILECKHFANFNNEITELFFEMLCFVAGLYPDLIQSQHVDVILQKCNNHFCNYIVRNGRTYLRESDCTSFLHKLFLLLK